MPETPTQSFDAGDNGSEDIKEGHPQSLPKTGLEGVPRKRNGCQAK